MWEHKGSPHLEREHVFKIRTTLFSDEKNYLKICLESKKAFEQKFCVKFEVGSKICNHLVERARKGGGVIKNSFF